MYSLGPEAETVSWKSKRDVGYRMVLFRVIGDLGQFLQPIMKVILLQVVSLPSGRNDVIYRDQATGMAAGLELG